MDMFSDQESDNSDTVQDSHAALSVKKYNTGNNLSIHPKGMS